MTAASANKERVGIVGVGRMGLAMAKHLLLRGYTVTVCDIDAKQLDKAREAGAAIAESPAGLGKGSDFVILGVGYADEVNEVTLGSGGLMETLARGAIVAVSSTVSPETVKALDERARAKGFDVLDAPTCRGRWAADAGQLLALLGGRDDVVARARPIYSAFCSDIAHLGEVGHGQVGKAMNNLLLWINAVGLIEAGRLADSTGIDLREAARGADAELGQLRRAGRLGHDHLHLGAQGHADRLGNDRQGRSVAADHRRNQGTRQGGAARQGDQPARVDRRQAREKGVRVTFPCNNRRMRRDRTWEKLL